MGSDLFMSKPAVITVLQFHLQFLPRNVPVRPTVSLTGNHLILPGRRVARSALIMPGCPIPPGTWFARIFSSNLSCTSEVCLATPLSEYVTLRAPGMLDDQDCRRA